MTSLANPRAPAAPLGAALYESHYLTAADPAGGRAVWVRFTALKRPGEPAHLTTWLTFFDASAGAPRALRVTADEPYADPGAAWARSSLGEIGPSGTRGELGDAAGAGRAGRPTAAARASWELRWEAMVGHNWGSEHAHQWCWVHAGRLGEDGRGWLDVVLVRIRIGPLVTPWIASGAVDLDGRRYAPAPLRRVTCERAGERTTVRVPLSGHAALTMELTAPRADTVTWDYASPRGPGRLVDHCSVADARIALETTGGTRSLAVIAAAAVEHGGVA